jgi:hypothetical protein
MRTKEKDKKNSRPAVEQHEPVDAELRATESQHNAEAEADDAVDAGTTTLGSTEIDLARLGLNQIAYIRRSVVDEQPVWSIHSAAGHPLGAALTFEQAWGAVVQNELQPMYVN